ncbi:MAG: protein kinase [Actinomycetota bacterium]|nr:protein kinase [Actinomycetota bacterium]
MTRPDPDPDPERHHDHVAGLDDLVDRALRRDKGAVATLLGRFEDRRPEMAASRADALAAIERRRGPRAPAPVVGITGTPGSGKSSLVSRIGRRLIEERPELSLAVVAVDPSSHVSGGALLGDRTRMRFPRGEPRLFFRSQASDTQLGGLGPATYQACRLLTELFDLVVVETVGIGQSEVDVRHLADRVYLVLSPLGGDEVQFLKAGIIEVPHAFVLNKCDEPTAERSYQQLRSSLWLARPFDGDDVVIHRTSARTGAGVDELVDDVLLLVTSGSPSDPDARTTYFYGRWVEDEWGRRGVVHLHAALGGASAHLAASGGFEAAQQAFDRSFVETLGS